MAVGSTRRERGHWRCATPARSLLTDAPRQRDREGTFEETATSFCFEGHLKGNRKRLEAPALLLRGTSGATESDRTATQSPASLCSRGASQLPRQKEPIETSVAAKRRILLYKPLSQQTGSDWHYKWHSKKKKRNSCGLGERHGTVAGLVGASSTLGRTIATF